MKWLFGSLAVLLPFWATVCVGVEAFYRFRSAEVAASEAVRAAGSFTVLCDAESMESRAHEAARPYLPVGAEVRFIGNCATTTVTYSVEYKQWGLIDIRQSAKDFNANSIRREAERAAEQASELRRALEAFQESARVFQVSLKAMRWPGPNVMDSLAPWNGRLLESRRPSLVPFGTSAG